MLEVYRARDRHYSHLPQFQLPTPKLLQTLFSALVNSRYRTTLSLDIIFSTSSNLIGQGLVPPSAQDITVETVIPAFDWPPVGDDRACGRLRATNDRPRLAWTGKCFTCSPDSHFTSSHSVAHHVLYRSHPRSAAPSLLETQCATRSHQIRRHHRSDMSIGPS
jgi:hypothetical protein